MFIDLHIPSNGHVESNKQKAITEDILAILGRNIRARRKETGWTQEALAEISGINDKEVSHIELGRRNVTIETLVKISTALGVSIEKLL